MDIRTETVACACGEEFERKTAVVRGREIVGPSICPGCIKAREQPRPIDPPPGPDVLAILDQLGVNVRKHGRCTLDNWTPTEGDAPARAAREFVDEMRAAGKYDPVRGLLLFGDTGTGKTHLATGIIRAAVESGVHPAAIVFDRADRLITSVQDTYGTGRTEHVLAERERALLWVVDDLGREKATPDVLRILTDLLSAREGHPTVVTSNCNPDELARRFESQEGWARLSSRLASSNFRAVRVKGPDRRFAA